MRDKNKPLKLADTLCFDARTMQKIFDADKYEASRRSGRDLCGNYAPFCSVCSRGVEYPCATAYRINERMALMGDYFDELGSDDICFIQSVADLDKYLACEGLGTDLCGRYAPFCSVCDKSLPYPCGRACVKYKDLISHPDKALVSQEGGKIAILSPDRSFCDAFADGVPETADECDGSIKIAVAKRRGNDL